MSKGIKNKFIINVESPYFEKNDIVMSRLYIEQKIIAVYNFKRIKKLLEYFKIDSVFYFVKTLSVTYDGDTVSKNWSFKKPDNFLNTNIKFK